MVKTPSALEMDFQRHLRAAGFWPLAALMLAASAIVGLVLFVRSAADSVDHTDLVIGRANLVEKLLYERQAKLRGYILTADPLWRSEYLEADGRVQPALDALRNHLNDDPSQAGRLDSIRPALARWTRFAEDALRSSAVKDSSDDVSQVAEGRRIQGELISRLDEIVSVEEGLRGAGVEALKRSIRTALLVGGWFALLVGPALAWATTYRMRRSRAAYRRALYEQERSLKASQEMLLLAQDAARMGAWDWDIVSGNMKWSDRCKALFNLRPDTTMSYDVFLAAVHPDDRERIDRAVQDALTNGARYNVEFRVPMQDGAVRWVESKGEAHCGPEGRPVRMSGIALDITPRKSAEEVLRDSEEKLRRYADLLQHAPVVVRDLENRIVEWNLGMERLYGWPRDEAIGKSAHELFETSFPEPLSDVMARLQRTGSWDGELVHRRRDGTRLVVASVWTLYRDAAGQPIAIVEVHNDITALKQAQEAIRESELRKDEFLGVLSHELRNPLAPIRNSVHILGRVDPASAQADRARTIIARQVDHLARLVDDLLDVKRISTGKLRLRTAVLDLRDTVRDTAEDLRSLFVRQSISLTLDIPESPVWVNGDRTRLAQVLGNLLQNAEKFTNNGGHVIVSLTVEGERALVHVRDDGVGAAPEILDSLFEPFVQSESTLHRSIGGLGLGLALVRGIAELHGGSVAARSEGLGKGAEFIVSLPTTAAPAAAQEEAASPVAGSKCRVLIVEDNQDAAQSLRDIVEMLGGHDVEVVHDGAVAVEAAARVHPDVVLCDIGLPGIDGYEVARRMRASDVAPHARIIALSGYASPDDVDRAIHAGFDYHIAKPPDIDLVMKLVAEAPTCGGNACDLPADLATGNHEVDSQHAAMLGAAARLRTASPGVVWETLRFLRRHTSSHFEYEDALMEDVGYPDARAHREQHESFLAQLRVFEEPLERDGPTPLNVELLATAVERWIAEHVLEADRQVADFIRRQRPDASPSRAVHTAA